MLEVRGIETYYGNIPALRKISIDVPAGSVVAILGANGAGKTTLMKTIAGVLRPRAGAVSFLGEEITGLPSHKIVRRGIALVPEGRAILSLAVFFIAGLALLLRVDVAKAEEEAGGARPTGRGTTP